jgi:ATP-binding cassette, subfamily B, bacterial
VQLPRLLFTAGRIVWQAGKIELVATVVLQLAVAACVAGQLLLGRTILASVLASSSSSHITLTGVLPQCVALVVVSLVILLAMAAQVDLSNILSELVARYTYGRILDVATRVDLACFESPDFFDQLERAATDGEVVAANIARGLVGVVGSIVTIVGIAVVLLTLSPYVLPLVLGACLPLWSANRRNGTAYYDFVYRMASLDRLRRYLATLLTNREAAKEIRAFNLSRYIRDRYDLLYDERILQLRNIAYRRVARLMAATVVGSLLIVAAVALMSTGAAGNHLRAASIVTALIAMLQLRSRVHGANEAAGSLYQSALLLDNYTSFLKMPAETHGAYRSHSAPARFQCLKVHNVCFTYPGCEVPTLTGVTFAIHAGELIALVGENGSGKSTLAKLLANLYTPDSGSIHWDGIDATTFDPRELRELITILFQDFVRYGLTARDNIVAGRVSSIADEARIASAAKQMGAQDFISELPHGLDTVLGKEFDGGHDLSLGQWQRLALARACFRDAPFVILDEPTAALDPLSEYQLIQSVRKMISGRAVLMVTHRFTTTRAADRILVFDAGELIEQGCHNDLIEANGHYAELYLTQASGYLG